MSFPTGQPTMIGLLVFDVRQDSAIWGIDGWVCWKWARRNVYSQRKSGWEGGKCGPVQRSPSLIPSRSKDNHHILRRIKYEMNSVLLSIVFSVARVHRATVMLACIVWGDIKVTYW